jgi:hypothetical protein
LGHAGSCGGTLSLLMGRFPFFVFSSGRKYSLFLVVSLLTADGKIEEKSVEKGDHWPWKKCR